VTTDTPAAAPPKPSPLMVRILSGSIFLALVIVLAAVLASMRGPVTPDHMMVLVE